MTSARKNPDLCKVRVNTVNLTGEILLKILKHSSTEKVRAWVLKKFVVKPTRM